MGERRFVRQIREREQTSHIPAGHGDITAIRSEVTSLIWSVKFGYVFAPLVGPVRLSILVDIENQGTSVTFLHCDVLASVRAHQGSRHQGETAGIVTRSD